MLVGKRCRRRARLHGLPSPVHQIDGVFAPGQEHHGLRHLQATAHHMVGEHPPAQLGVRRRGVLAHRERGVEQQHALRGPRCQIPALGHRASQVGGHLLVHVAKAGGQLAASGHGKRQPHGLPRPVIRVLAQDDHLHVRRRGERKRVKDIVLRRIDGLLIPHSLHLRQQLLRGFAHLVGRGIKPRAHVLVRAHGTSFL